VDVLHSHGMLSVFAPAWGSINALHGCVHYLGFASPACEVVTANVLSPADYENFYGLDLKMLSIGDDVYGLMTTQPAAHAPDCVVELAFKFDAVQADLHSLGTLVALAAIMADNADELRVIQQLSLASRRFLEQLKYHRLILNNVMSNCAENDAIAKSLEISHTWNDAASLVQSIVKKIGASQR